MPVAAELLAVLVRQVEQSVAVDGCQSASSVSRRCELTVLSRRCAEKRLGAFAVCCWCCEDVRR